ncbi:SH3 domain-containing protein [Corallococcus exiguus]|nr:SH3 domain-containing protein [Corallococcus exiguus]NNB95469.1 SH3 domain-containing protein [Corallococcus exiguus]NNC03488.1 SH3 domain-containing protein [Corallococcus exiguus]NPC51058.1 SH3 domain-containing protein [Corallococcus exiguus]RKH76483.1 SH3 domain-containing protein [Corallococcus sp. AB032C]
MMTPSALLLSLFLSQEPDSETVLEYSAAMAEEGAAPAPESFEFTAFTAGQMVYLGVDEGNLRANAAADAAVVQTLMLGTPVKVVKAGTRAKVGEYVNTWYQVTVVDAKAPAGAAPVTGWVFGNTLTPFRFEADLDGDGEMEVATVVMSNEFKARVRVLEPNVKPPRRVSSVDVMVASTVYGGGNGGPVKVKLVPAKQAGVTLLQLDSTPERCGDYVTSYVSYTGSNGKPGVLGKAKLALELGGLMDPPNTSSYKVSFQPAAKRALVVRTNVEEEDGKPQTVTEREVYQWKDGVFAQAKPVAKP